MSSESVNQRGHPRGGVDRGQVIGGVIVIAIGVLLLAGQTMEQVGQYIPLLIGGALLLGFLLTRNYGLLVPGGIITGVGVGIVLVTSDPTGTRGPLLLVALALGFMSIWVLGLLFRLAENHWWPLLPGGILLAIGTLSLIGPEARQIIDLWPVLLVVAGLAVMAQAFMRRQPT